MRLRILALVALTGLTACSEKTQGPVESVENRVYLNGREYGAFDDQELADLVDTLQRYRIASEASKNEALITIAAADDTKHQRVIDVMNACANAGIKNVTFSGSSE